MLETYIVVLTGIVLAQAAPGPNLLAVASVALGQGRVPSVFAALGVSLAIFIWVALVALGLSAILNLYPGLLTLMKLIGGGYLLFLAIKGARAAIAGAKPTLKAEVSQSSNLAAFQKGFFVNITNPKSALMWSAVATFLFGSGFSSVQVMTFAPIGALTAFCIYGSYGFLFSSETMRKLYIKAARWFDALFGVAFGAIGGKLFIDGLKEIKQ